MMKRCHRDNGRAMSAADSIEDRMAFYEKRHAELVAMRRRSKWQDVALANTAQRLALLRASLKRQAAGVAA